MDWQDLTLVLTRPIAYHRIFARIGGGAAAGLFLSQAFYWSFRTNSTEGWFYKTGIEWEEETGLTRCEQETARKKLIAKGLLEEKKEGVPCKLYYRIQQNNIMNAIAQVKAAQIESQSQFAGNQQTSLQDLPNQFAENQQTGLRETNKLVCGKPANFLYTETTTEITSETTHTPLTPLGGENARELEIEISEPQDKGQTKDSKEERKPEKKKAVKQTKAPRSSIENDEAIVRDGDRAMPTASVPPWQQSDIPDNYHSGFLDYLVSTYLPTVGKWRDMPIVPTLGDAKTWIALREKKENYAQIQNKWDDYQARQRPPSPTPYIPPTPRPDIPVTEETLKAKAEARAYLESLKLL
jgi:hypothetical protein